MLHRGVGVEVELEPRPRGGDMCMIYMSAGQSVDATMERSGRETMERRGIHKNQSTRGTRARFHTKIHVQYKHSKADSNPSERICDEDEM